MIYFKIFGHVVSSFAQIAFELRTDKQFGYKTACPAHKGRGEVEQTAKILGV